MPKNQSITQKKYCNKFNKDFKNDPHQKKILKKKRVIYNHYLYFLTHHFNLICAPNMLLKGQQWDRNAKFKSLFSRLSILVIFRESENLYHLLLEIQIFLLAFSTLFYHHILRHIHGLFFLPLKFCFLPELYPQHSPIILSILVISHFKYRPRANA